MHETARPLFARAHAHDTARRPRPLPMPPACHGACAPAFPLIARRSLQPPWERPPLVFSGRWRALCPHSAPAATCSHVAPPARTALLAPLPACCTLLPPLLSPPPSRIEASSPPAHASGRASTLHHHSPAVTFIAPQRGGQGGDWPGRDLRRARCRPVAYPALPQQHLGSCRLHIFNSSTPDVDAGSVPEPAQGCSPCAPRSWAGPAACRCCDSVGKRCASSEAAGTGSSAVSRARGFRVAPPARLQPVPGAHQAHRITPCRPTKRQPRTCCSAAAGGAAAAPPPEQQPSTRREQFARLADFLTMLFPVWASSGGLAGVKEAPAFAAAGGPACRCEPPQHAPRPPPRLLLCSAGPHLRLHRLLRALVAQLDDDGAV